MVGITQIKARSFEITKLLDQNKNKMQTLRGIFLLSRNLLDMYG